MLAGCLALPLFATTPATPVLAVASEAAGSPYPAPGTYKLYKIQKAASGWVLEHNAWLPRRLSSYTTGSITLFTFFYTTCIDPLGCPVAWSVFESVRQEVVRDPALHGRVRLVFVSLDPKADTPERLELFYPSRQSDQAIAPWHFLTTWSESYLRPILDGMGQTAARERDDFGRPTEVINHMIKVHLIDDEGWIREIYSTNFLDATVVMNDIRTLIMEKKSVLPATQ